MTSRNGDVAKLVKSLRADGWLVDQSKRACHFQVRDPENGKLVTVFASSPGQFWNDVRNALEQFWNDVRNALEQVIIIVIVPRAARRAFGHRPGEQAAPQGEEKAAGETPGRRIVSGGIISEGSYRSAHRLPVCYMGYGYGTWYPEEKEHRRAGRCQVHSRVPDPWAGWYEARERYAKPGSNDAAREVAMADLLSYVTARECYAEPGSNDAADNPPAADPLPVHRPVPPSRVPRWSALSLGLAGWEFLVFGLAFYRPLLIVAMCCFVSAVMICFGWWERF